MNSPSSRNEPFRRQIHRGYVSPFVAIAQRAGICQVAGAGKAAMFPAHDVIDLMRKSGVLLMDEAVFVAVTRAPGYFGTKFAADITGHRKGFGEPAPLPSSGYVPVP